MTLGGGFIILCLQWPREVPHQTSSVISSIRNPFRKRSYSVNDKPCWIWGKPIQSGLWCFVMIQALTYIDPLTASTPLQTHSAGDGMVINHHRNILLLLLRILFLVPREIDSKTHKRLGCPKLRAPKSSSFAGVLSNSQNCPAGPCPAPCGKTCLQCFQRANNEGRLSHRRRVAPWLRASKTPSQFLPKSPQQVFTNYSYIY